MHSPSERRPLRLLDIAALIVGYGLAAVLVRAYWLRGGSPMGGMLALFGLIHLWLGLAMAGPLVLLLDRRSREDMRSKADAPQYTWAETAWILIGGYWIAMTLFLVPSRVPITALLGVFPIVLALLVRFFSPSRTATTHSPPGWTHFAAVGMLVTWPLAWVAMIVMGTTM